MFSSHRQGFWLWNSKRYAREFRWGLGGLLSYGFILDLELDREFVQSKNEEEEKERKWGGKYKNDKNKEFFRCNSQFKWENGSPGEVTNRKWTHSRIQVYSWQTVRIQIFKGESTDQELRDPPRVAWNWANQERAGQIEKTAKEERPTQWEIPK